MSRKQLILSWMAVVALLGVTDFYFLHILFPLKKAALLEQLNRNVENHLREDPPTGHDDVKTENAEPENRPAADSFATALRSCLDGNDVSPDALIDRLERDLASRTLELENWHLRRPDGRQERVMLMGGGPTKREVRLFGVDAEGLPVPKKLDAAKAINPSDQMIESLVKSGEITFHQTQETLKFKNGLSASVERVNGRIRDLQVFAGGKTLSCRERDCQCK